MLRKCAETDFSDLLAVINDSAAAYKGRIPPDCWHDPYMSPEYLQHETDDGVEFWGFEETGRLLGVMGIQDRKDVALVRHAYVLTGERNRGIGTGLLRHIEKLTVKPLLVGTWKAAVWAIAFYRKNGYALVCEEEKNALLKKYWSIDARQIETSVVLRKPARPSSGDPGACS